jgi:hypothetical protein
MPTSLTPFASQPITHLIWLGSPATRITIPSSGAPARGPAPCSPGPWGSRTPARKPDQRLGHNPQPGAYLPLRRPTDRRASSRRSSENRRALVPSPGLLWPNLMRHFSPPGCPAGVNSVGRGLPPSHRPPAVKCHHSAANARKAASVRQLTRFTDGPASAAAGALGYRMLGHLARRGRWGRECTPASRPGGRSSPKAAQAAPLRSAPMEVMTVSGSVASVFLSQDGRPTDPARCGP